MVSSLSTAPAATIFCSAARLVAADGSTKMLSILARSFSASRISSSSTLTAAPFDSFNALMIFLPSNGSPTQMAEATVLGMAMGSMLLLPLNAVMTGSAPLACTPTILGRLSVKPSIRYSLKPFQMAEPFVPQPMGMNSLSGALQPSCSAISNAWDFCPSRRYA